MKCRNGIFQIIGLIGLLLSGCDNRHALKVQAVRDSLYKDDSLMAVYVMGELAARVIVPQEGDSGVVRDTIKKPLTLPVLSPKDRIVKKTIAVDSCQENEAKDTAAAVLPPNFPSSLKPAPITPVAPSTLKPSTVKKPTVPKPTAAPVATKAPVPTVAAPVEPKKENPVQEDKKEVPKPENQPKKEAEAPKPDGK